MEMLTLRFSKTANAGFLGFLVDIWKLMMGMDCCHL